MPLFKDRQVQFPPMQTHVKAFEWVMIGVSIACVVALLIVVLGTDLGNSARP